MSKAEKFISDYTRNCSNEIIVEQGENYKVIDGYHLWLTPKEARKVAEIAREETIKEVCEWLCNHYRDYMHNPTGKQLEAFFGMDMITGLKQAMKDE